MSRLIRKVVTQLFIARMYPICCVHLLLRHCVNLQYYSSLSTMFVHNQCTPSTYWEYTLRKTYIPTEVNISNLWACFTWQRLHTLKRNTRIFRVGGKGYIFIKLILFFIFTFCHLHSKVKSSFILLYRLRNLKAFPMEY